MVWYSWKLLTSRQTTITPAHFNEMVPIVDLITWFPWRILSHCSHRESYHMVPIENIIIYIFIISNFITYERRSQGSGGSFAREVGSFYFEILPLFSIVSFESLSPTFLVHYYTYCPHPTFRSTPYASVTWFAQEIF